MLKCRVDWPSLKPGLSASLIKLVIKLSPVSPFRAASVPDSHFLLLLIAKLRRQRAFSPGLDTLGLTCSRPLARAPVCIRVHLVALHFCSFPPTRSEVFSDPISFGNINGFKWGLDKVGKLEGVRIGRGRMHHACFSQQVFTERLLGAWLLASC